MRPSICWLRKSTSGDEHLTMASLPTHSSGKGLNPKMPSSTGRPMSSANCISPPCFSSVTTGMFLGEQGHVRVADTGICQLPFHNFPPSLVSSNPRKVVKASHLGNLRLLLCRGPSGHRQAGPGGNPQCSCLALQRMHGSQIPNLLEGGARSANSLRAGETSGQHLSCHSC